MITATQACILMATLIGLGHTSVPSLNVSIRTDNHDDFEAGSPRVLACIVFGCAPSSPIVTWYLGDTMLRPNVYKEVNRGNYTVSSLTFVPSLSDNGKELVCKVTNDFMAETFEDKVTVTVGHRPTCINSGFQTIEAVEGESETIVCRVTSDPEPEQFIWTFADGRTIYTTSKKVSGRDTQYSTTLVWVVRADDFGPLFCRASNRFGEQKQPCTFSVIKSGLRTTLKCNTSWEDQESLKVPCEKNWDVATSNPTSSSQEVNYEHPEDMPPNRVYKSKASITPLTICISTVVVLCVMVLCCFFIKAKCAHNEDIPDIIDSAGISITVDQIPTQFSNEYIQMQGLSGFERSANVAKHQIGKEGRECSCKATYKKHEHIYQSDGPFLEQQMFHV